MQQIHFIDIFKSALHVSGDKLAHPQEHFLTVYTAFGTMHRYCCLPARMGGFCRNRMCLHARDSSCCGCGHVAGCFEHGHEASGAIKRGESFDYLRNC